LIYKKKKKKKKRKKKYINLKKNKKLFYPFSENHELSELWWRNTNDVYCKDLKRLASSLPKVVEAAFSNATNKKYSRGWRNWLAWASTKSEITPIPADPFYVALCLKFILQCSGTKGALTDSFYGITWGHHISGFSSPTDHAFLQAVFESV